MFDKLKKLNQFISNLDKDPYDGMSDNEKKFAKLSNLLKLLGENVTKKDFESNFKIIIDLVKRIIERNNKELELIKKNYDAVIGSIKEKMFSVRDGERGERGFQDSHGLDGRDGADGPPGPPGVPGEAGSPDTPIQVRDKLEDLRDDERLKISAIRGLEEELEKLKNVKVGAVGGLRPAPTGVETPSGTINGTNKAFTVTFTPQWVTINGQCLYANNGYVLTSASGILTITLDNAPISGDVLRSHY